MLLNPKDFTYEYFHQPRGEDGFSEAIYLGTPCKDELCPILIKSAYYSDAINEFIGCNIGQRIGVNTPKAWLFNPKGTSKQSKINFYRAVGIEYLEGFNEGDENGSFENEELAKQTIKGKIFHLLMGDYDNRSLALCNGKIYAYDFADGMYPKGMGIKLISDFFTKRNKHGFTEYEHRMMAHEEFARGEIRAYRYGLRNERDQMDLWPVVYTELRDSLMKEYEKNGFEDLIMEIRTVFSEDAAMYVRDLIKSTLSMMEDFLCLDGVYFRMDDGVLLMIDKEKADQYEMVDEDSL